MTEATRRTRVFLVDDYEIVRAGARALIEAQPDMGVVGEAADGCLAYDGIRLLQWQHSEDVPAIDVVLMDVSMPNWNGVEATYRIKRDWPQIKVLALSTHGERPYVRAMLEAGASGYVLKRSPASEFLRGIRAVAAGAKHLDPALATVLADSLTHRPVRGVLEGASLSDREEQVMILIAQGYANKEIAAQLKLSVKTVETHKARSSEKLRLDGRVDLVRYALANGWFRDMD